MTGRTILKRLDDLEDAGEEIPPEQRLYNRERIDTEKGSAWVYIYNGDVPPSAKVTSDWLKEHPPLYSRIR